MNEIQFMEKPDWVSWEQVCDCIKAANVVNNKKGFHMLFANITPDEIESELKDGKCFVAIHEGKVVGTTSYAIQEMNKWYLRGKVILHCFDAIRPEYRGTDVYFGVQALKAQKIEETGIKRFYFTTAEKNKTVIKMNLRYGFKLVQLTPSPKGGDYYSVCMVMWNDGCPFPDWFLKFMFNLSKIVSKTLWKPGYKRRFWG